MTRAQLAQSAVCFLFLLFLSLYFFMFACLWGKLHILLPGLVALERLRYVIKDLIFVAQVKAVNKHGSAFIVSRATQSLGLAGALHLSAKLLLLSELIQSSSKVVGQKVMWLRIRPVVQRRARGR